MFQKPTDGLEVFRKLGEQFATNFNKALSIAPIEARRIELKGRCLSAVGIILKEKYSVNDTQKEIAGIYDEVFADCVCSIFLAGQGLDRPAQLVLRRVLELGVAAIYLWDLPHIYWGWKEYDCDLSFKEMCEHLSSPQYLRYVGAMNNVGEALPVFDVTAARSEYRALSNAVHGKVTTFETAIANRFQHSDTD